MRSLCDVVIEEGLIDKEVVFKTIWHGNQWEVAKITGVDRRAGLIYFVGEIVDFRLPEAEIIYLVVGDTIYDNPEDSKYYVRLLNVVNAILGFLGAIFVYWMLFKIFN